RCALNRRGAPSVVSGTGRVHLTRLVSLPIDGADLELRRGRSARTCDSARRWSVSRSPDRTLGPRGSETRTKKTLDDGKGTRRAPSGHDEVNRWLLGAIREPRRQV